MPESADRKGFVLYRNYIDTVSELTDEQAGRLFKAVLAHVNERELPPLGDAERIAFSFIKSQLSIDADKYDRRCQASRENGKKGGRPKKTEETKINPENPVGFEKSNISEEIPQEPAVEIASEPDKKPERKTKDYTPEFEELWKLYPKKDDKWNAFLKYQARRKHFSHDQLITAVSCYVTEQRRKGTDLKYYKQLQTFISSDKADFTRYLAQKEIPEKQQQDSDDDWATFFNGGH